MDVRTPGLDTTPERARVQNYVPAGKIALAYLVVSVLWILLSDWAVADIAPDLETLTRLQTVKGWLFVLGSAVLIFLLVSAVLRDMRAAVSLRVRDAARFRAMIEHLEEAIVVLNQDGTVRYGSPSLALLVGQPLADVEGTALTDLVAPGDVEQARQLLNASRSDPVEPQRAELRIERDDGDVRHAEVTVRCLLDDPSVSGLVMNVRDVTEQRQLQQKFRQAQKMEALGRLAGGVVHDFNNALTVIQGCGENLLDRAGDDAAIAREVRELIKAAKHGEGVVRQLLTFSRERPVARDTIDIHARIREISSVLRTAVPSRIELDFQLEAEHPWIRIGRDHLEQILMNLVVNARDAMPDTGELVVATRDVDTDPAGGEGRSVELTVRDTGSGISAAVQDKIFEPFFTTKPEGRGTGLGLATVFGTVQQNGGTITFDTELGQGTTFRIRFPAVAAPVGPAAAVGMREPADPSDPSGTETVLVVDDEPGVRAVATRGLSRFGYTVLEAGDGEEALRVLREQGPVDMVVTDTVMPRMGGMDLARQIARLDDPPVVLLVSGHPRDEMEMTEGIEFLEKPYDLATLARRVRRGLDAAT